MNLELIQNAIDPRSKHSLYGLLNQTQTPGGARLLRSSILTPVRSKISALVHHYTEQDELIAYRYRHD